jgi:hypothetical protein
LRDKVARSAGEDLQQAPFGGGEAYVGARATARRSAKSREKSGVTTAATDDAASGSRRRRATRTASPHGVAALLDDQVAAVPRA